MKLPIDIYILICITIALTTYQFSLIYNKNKKYHYQSHPHLEICRKPKKIHHGPSLTSHFNDTTDLVLCPGDTFGDLKETFVRLEGKECFLAMHHQGKIIWSSEKPEDYDNGFLCAASIERDGNLVVYKERLYPNNPYREEITVIWPAWSSQTNFHPNKTEVRIRDQQLQIVHTLEDESERMFYIGEGIIRGGFWEYLGAPTQVAKEFLIINHNNDSDDSTILRKNEYIGDLNGLHLIFQTNCELQFLNKTQLIWSFADSLGFKLDEKCTLGIEEQNSIGISGISATRSYLYGAMKILLCSDFNVLQSNITFQGDRLLVIQTLKDGSEITFYSEPGQDNGLKLKTELKQIAKNSLTILSKTKPFLNRNEYIGDLDGLHLILQNNCDFVLANGKLELWKLQIIATPPYMECFLQFNYFADGTIKFDRTTNNRGPSDGESRQIFGHESYSRRGPSAEKFKISLENNLMIINLKFEKKAPEIYHAGLNTNGTWFRFLSDHSLTINANAKKDKIFPEMGYIGDINGVYAILDKYGNLILFNKTTPIWESGTTEDYDNRFVLIFTREGDVAVSHEWSVSNKDYLWSTEITNSYKKAPLKKSELFVNPSGMWLVKIYVDGTVQKFKALEGTNKFILVSGGQDESGSSLSKISEL